MLLGVNIKKIKMSHKGRKCRFRRCKHILSIYNHEAYCHIHLGQATQEYKHKITK
ncbi:MAG: hypothetical protein WA066_06855 [Candidatus Omnitrophota bacterium]